MKPKIIRTEEEYERALERADQLMDAAARTKEADELDLLVLLISDYEERHYPIEAPEPHDSFKYHIERVGLSKADVAKLFGSAERAREILAGRRPITLALAKKLKEVLDIPDETLFRAVTREVQKPKTRQQAATRRRSAAA